MTDVLPGLFFNLIFMTVVGAGPSLFLVRGKDRWGVALGICPVVGLVLISVAGTGLTLLDLPVSRWSMPASIVGTLFSVILILLAVLHDRTAYSDRTAFPVMSLRPLFVPVGVFLITCALAMTPQMVGGLQYSVLRGNGTDSFNYLTLAGYLDHEPYSWAFKTDPESLVQRHLTYVRSRTLLRTRWTTSMMLAFSSRLARVDPYEFEYSFSVLCLLLAFGPVFLWCNRLLDVPPLYSALTAAVVSAGFWGQLVLDLRADSHQHAIPVLMLFGFLVARIEAIERDRPPWSEHVLLGLTATSLMLIYPEIVPTAVLGFLFFLAIRIGKGLTSGIRLAGWALSICIAIVSLFPMGADLYRFASRQMNYASNGINTWHLNYFRWLYSSPLTGLWGFGPLVAGNTFTAHGLHLALRPLAILLTIALVAAIATSTSKLASRRPGITLSATLAAAAIAQWGYLYSRGQLWAAAKGLSFGYPFLIICVVSYGLSREPSTPTAHGLAGGWQRWWKAGIAVSVSVFLAIQCALAVYRPWLAMHGAGYAGYVDDHGDYRRHDWSLNPFERVLKPQRGLTVWSDVSDPWVSDYIGLVLGWDVHLVSLGASRDVVEGTAPRQPIDRQPDYLIVESSSFSAGSHHGGGMVVAQTGDLSLLRADGTPAIAAVENPNGLEGGADIPFFWMGGGPTILHVVAPSDGCAVLRARFLLGPSGPDLPSRHLTLTTGDSSRQQVLVKDGLQDLHFRTAKGVNDVLLEVEEKATVALRGDRRSLLLGVDDPRLERGACPNDQR
jgi:hypothetical protein